MRSAFISAKIWACIFLPASPVKTLVACLGRVGVNYTPLRTYLVEGNSLFVVIFRAVEADELAL